MWSQICFDTTGDDLCLNPYEAGKSSQRNAYDANMKAIVNCEDRGSVIDIYSKNDDDGATVGKWGWKEGPNQMWRFEYV